MEKELLILNEARNVTLTAYLQEVNGEFGFDKRPAILILPGGGYARTRRQRVRAARSGCCKQAGELVPPAGNCRKPVARNRRRPSRTAQQGRPRHLRRPPH